MVIGVYIYIYMRSLIWVLRIKIIKWLYRMVIKWLLIIN